MEWKSNERLGYEAYYLASGSLLQLSCCFGDTDGTGQARVKHEVI